MLEMWRLRIPRGSVGSGMRYISQRFWDGISVLSLLVEYFKFGDSGNPKLVQFFLNMLSFGFLKLITIHLQHLQTAIFSNIVFSLLDYSIMATRSVLLV